MFYIILLLIVIILMITLKPKLGKPTTLSCSVLHLQEYNFPNWSSSLLSTCMINGWRMVQGMLSTPVKQTAIWLKWILYLLSGLCIGLLKACCVRWSWNHITYYTILIAIRNRIINVCLPAHHSHATQPLVMAVFKFVKQNWMMIPMRHYDIKLERVD